MGEKNKGNSEQKQQNTRSGPLQNDRKFSRDFNSHKMTVFQLKKNPQCNIYQFTFISLVFIFPSIGNLCMKTYIFYTIHFIYCQKGTFHFQCIFSYLIVILSLSLFKVFNIFFSFVLNFTSTNSVQLEIIVICNNQSFLVIVLICHFSVTSSNFFLKRTL